MLPVVLLIFLIISISRLAALTIDKGLENYKILRESSTGQFNIPEGWTVLSLADLGHPAVQAAMLSLFTDSWEVEKFNRGELKVIRRIEVEEEVPEYDIVSRTTPHDKYIIPNGWQRLPDSQLTQPGLDSMLEMLFLQNEKYRQDYHNGLLAVIKKGWVRVPINQENSDKFQPIFVEQLTLGEGDTEVQHWADVPQVFTEIKT